eukprot:Plantae.Rhodophyta-Hildenbrandia_rubra.ctg5663.p1 GENE.Plantae.Rhodophyta-Hildenbrandia_rubra.ctg5663~~Plantae.Rhodophyta-Hildenbrandia_rubra.ctg5663.p1  ORF type:complete len:741 (-),score=118.79 Plantae.Rhodophyta-Hildenbrandia_rubra.ctg5663:1137-3359(-)
MALVAIAGDLIRKALPMPIVDMRFTPIRWKRNQVNRIRRTIIKDLKDELGGPIWDVQMIDGTSERQLSWALMGSCDEEGTWAALANLYFDISAELRCGNAVTKDWAKQAGTWTQNNNAASLCVQELVNEPGQNSSQEFSNFAGCPTLVHAETVFKSRYENDIVYKLEDAYQDLDHKKRQFVYGKAVGAMALWGVLARSLEYSLRDDDFNFIRKQSDKVVTLAARFMDMEMEDMKLLKSAIFSAISAVEGGCDSYALRRFIGLLASPLWSFAKNTIGKHVITTHTRWNLELARTWERMAGKASRAHALAKKEWKRLKSDWPEIEGRSRKGCSLCTKAGDNWVRRAQQSNRNGSSIGSCLFDKISVSPIKSDDTQSPQAENGRSSASRSKYKISEAWLDSAKSLCSAFTVIVGYVHVSQRGEEAASPSLAAAVRFAKSIGMNIEEDCDGLVSMVIGKAYERGAGENRLVRRSLPKSPTLTISEGDICFFFPENHSAFAMARRTRTSDEKYIQAAQRAMNDSLTYLDERPSKIGLVCLKHIIASLKPSITEDRWYESKTRMQLVIGLANEGGERLLMHFEDERTAPLSEEYSLAQCSWGSLLKLIEKTTVSTTAAERAWVCRAVISHLRDRGVKPLEGRGPTCYWNLEKGAKGRKQLIEKDNSMKGMTIRVDWPVPLMGSLWHRDKNGKLWSGKVLLEGSIDSWTPATRWEKRVSASVKLLAMDRDSHERTGALVVCGNEWAG